MNWRRNGVAISWLALAGMFLMLGDARRARCQGVRLAPPVAAAERSERTSTFDESGELPSLVDLRPHLPVPGDQGDKNSCVAWVVAHACYSCQISQQRQRPPTEPSGVFSSEHLHATIPDREGGLLASQVIGHVLRHGAASRAAVALSESDDGDFADAEASTYLAIAAEQAFDLGAIKAFLHQGYPVMLIIELDDEFKADANSSSPYRWSGVSSGDYHAVTAVGYDDRRDAVLVMNSWGDDWKEGGFCWVSADNFSDIGRDHWCAETHVVIVKPSPPYNASMPDAGGSPRFRFRRRRFELRDNQKVYEDDELLTPTDWRIESIACSEEDLFILDEDGSPFRMNEERRGGRFAPVRRSWTHLDRGLLGGQPVTMIASSDTAPLHVLTAMGTLFRYRDGDDTWGRAGLPESATRRVVDLRMAKDGAEMRATTLAGRTFVFQEDRGWQLAP